MQKNLVVKTNKETEATVEEMYLLEKAAFRQWTEAGLYTPIAYTPIDQFKRYIKDKAGVNWGRFW